MIAKICSIIVKKLLHDDKWVKADTVDVKFDNGAEMTDFLRLTVKNGGCVSVCARLKDGRFILTQQCRPVAGFSIESVTGGGESGKSWEKLAVREMVQETGYKPGMLEHIGNFYTQTNRIDNKCHLFLAFDCIEAEEKLEPDEVQGIEHIILTPEEVLEMIKLGKIKDMITIAGIFAHLCYQSNIKGMREILYS